MLQIKFGTDGWRSLIANDFTVDNVMRISVGAAKWMLQKGNKKVIIGFDTRFAGLMFAKAAAIPFAEKGIKVLIDPEFVTTPMVSFATREWKAGLGVVITASHNPPDYNGYKLKSKSGGPLLSDGIKEIEALIPDYKPISKADFDFYANKGLIEEVNLESIYFDHLKNNFDLDSIMNASNSIAYDSMFGAGRKIMRKLFPDAIHLHDENNPGFKGIPPEPILRNLMELEHLVRTEKDIKIGIANDGDADRIGLFDEDGIFVDAHHILLLLLYYQVTLKKLSGKVVVSAAATEKLEKLAKIYGLGFQYTKIGFKNITPIMLNEDVLLAGEEAGGMATKGHLPERDGIWVSLMILEMMNRTGKSLKELIEVIYELVGSFAYDRIDLKLPEELKTKIVKRCESGQISEIGGEKVISTLDVDGYKYYLAEDKWIMIRPSGTEPVLRLYAQAENTTEVQSLLHRVVKELNPEK